MKLRTPAQRAIALLSSTCALAALAAPGVALAQDAPESDTTAQEEPEERRSALDSVNNIIVTGTKTQNVEDVQDVALAVTAFNADTLEAFKVRDIQGLQFQAPNVSLDQIGTSRGNANFSIRGLGINSSIPSIDPTVGVFVDGVYLGINGGVVFDIFDVESVEILRGPQGVLFGRNVTGGAVLLNTTNPTEDFRGKFRASVDGPVGDNNGGANFIVSGVLTGPIIEDKLLFKVAAYHNTDNGPFVNQFDGSNFGEADTTIVRGALEARLGDLTLTAKGDYFDSNGDGPNGQNRGFFERDSFDFAIDNPGFYDTEIFTGSLTAEWDIGPGTLTNVFGYRDYNALTDADIDATTAPIFNSDTETDQDQISNELRYAVSTDSFDLTVGGFYFDQTLAYTESRRIINAPQFFGGGRQDHEVLGVFAAGEYKVTDALSIIAGIRWSQETKDAEVTYVRPRPECSVVDRTCPTTGTNPILLDANGNPTENNGFTDRVRFRNVSPKLGLQYELANGQIYGHWTRGFRSGGYNFRITNANAFEAIVGTDFAFDEEQVDNFEIGGKFQDDEGNITLNVAAYYTTVQDMQREVNQADPQSGVAQSIFNTADATILGLELDTRIRVTEGLLVTGNVGVIDAEYDEILFDISGDGVINGADLQLRIPRVPEITYGLGFIHELFLGDNEIITRFNWQYRDDFAFTDDNRGFIQSINNIEGNITWVTPIEGFSLSVYGRNLLDEVQAGGDTQLPFGGPLSNGINQPFDQFPGAGTFSPLQRGRTLGVEAVFEF